MTISFEEGLKQKIEEAIEKRIETIREEIIEEAVAQFKIFVRQEVGKAAISVANYYSVQKTATEFIITVRHFDGLQGDIAPKP